MKSDFERKDILGDMAQRLHLMAAFRSYIGNAILFFSFLLTYI
jgi:hypothetical protein